MQNILDLETGVTLLVNKPLNWTSFDAVNKIRFAYKVALNKKKVKVGHAGTLDPLATGLLVIGCGTHTKKLTELTGQDKTYQTTLTLGGRTASHDLESPVEAGSEWKDITKEQVNAFCQGMVGELLQRPPLFSAKRTNGKRAYELARQGVKMVLPPHLVLVHGVKVTRFALPQVDIEIRSGKGFYVRAMARDIGEALGCGAYLSALHRTASGDLGVAGARTPEEWCAEIAKAATARASA